MKKGYTLDELKELIRGDHGQEVRVKIVDLAYTLGRIAQQGEVVARAEARAREAESRIGGNNAT